MLIRLNIESHVGLHRPCSRFTSSRLRRSCWSSWWAGRWCWISLSEFMLDSWSEFIMSGVVVVWLHQRSSSKGRMDVHVGDGSVVVAFVVRSLELGGIRFFGRGLVHSRRTSEAATNLRTLTEADVTPEARKTISTRFNFSDSQQQFHSQQFNARHFSTRRFSTRQPSMSKVQDREQTRLGRDSWAIT